MPSDLRQPEATEEGRWETVGRFLSVLLSDADPESVTRGLSRALASLIPHDDLRISLDPTVETWWLKPGGFEVQRYDPPLSGADDNVSALRWVALHHQPLLRSDLNKDIRFVKDRLVLDEGRVSSLYIPLFGPEGYFGVISVAASRPGQYDARSLSDLEWVGQQIGPSLASFAHRYRDRSTGGFPIDRRFSTSLERTLEHMLTQIRKRGYDRVRIYLYDVVKDEMVGGAQVGVDRYESFKGTRLRVSEDPYTQMTLSGRLGRVYRHDENESAPWLNQDLRVSKTSDWAELPLVVDEEGDRVIVGKISIDNNPTGRPINESALASLMGLADAAALAIRNAQLYESKVVDTERSVRIAESRLTQQHALLEISNAVQRMAGPEDMERVLKVSLEGMCALGMAVDAVAIHRVLDVEASEIETYRTAVNGAITTGQRRKSLNLCRLWKQGGRLSVDDIEKDQPGKGVAAFRQKFDGLSIRSLLDLPFSLGVISVHSCTPGAFEDANPEIVIQMAEVISLGALRMSDLQRADEARRALQDSEQRYREIVQGAPVCIHEIDLDGRLTSMNPAGLCMLGLEAEEQVRGTDYLDEVAAHDRDRIGRLLERAVAGESAFFEFDTASGGHRFQSSFIPILDSEGKVTRLIGMTEDITERTRQEEALRKSETTHRRAIESIGGIPYVYDYGSDSYAFVGDGVGDLFECEPDAFTREYFVSRIESNELVEDAHRRPEKSGQRLWNVREYRLTRKNGEAGWVRDTFVVTLDEDGNRVSSFGVLQDVTKQRLADAEMVRIQRLNAAWELSAGISHNLNNILTGVIGPAQMMAENAGDPDVRAQAKDITDAGIRARDLIRQLYAPSRGPEPELEAVDLVEVVNDAILTTRPRWRDQSEAEGLSVKMVMGVPQMPAVKATRLELHDVLVNLILNAVDAMPVGGTIQIDATESESNVVLRVRDDGQGMVRDVQSRLFEPFFTTKAEVGTGLGLYMVYHTVRSFGGHISVDSEPGAGTTFTISLVYADEGEASSEASVEGGDEVVGARILVVEDEPFVREFLQAALGADNDLEMYDHPQKALTALEDTVFDVVIADLGLPDTPGDRFLAEVAERLPCAARVLMTGWELAEGDERRQPADFYMQKPVELNHLFKVVHDARSLSIERDR